jgi:hypothetical protein
MKDIKKNIPIKHKKESRSDLNLSLIVAIFIFLRAFGVPPSGGK